MKIQMNEISVKEVVSQYKDSQEHGVVGYSGRLNIRPAFQREFVYEAEDRASVVLTVLKGFPLSIMYWSKNGNEETFELMDGQQRTISIAQYINNEFSIIINGQPRYFHNLTADEQEQILDYKLLIYICEGSIDEKLDWFCTINKAGIELTSQELLNAQYIGPWLADAKAHFSKPGCAALQIGEKYLKGKVIRQEFLEKALTWIAKRDGITLKEYMARHQHDADAQELWDYFQQVMDWVKRVFPTPRKEMKGLEWGFLFNQFASHTYNASTIEQQLVQLMQDDEITKKSGIYTYLLSGDERYLNLRAFSEKIKREAYEQQKGICPACGNHFEYEEMEGDHIIPWSKGGKTTLDNCHMLCMKDNRQKSAK